MQRVSNKSRPPLNSLKDYFQNFRTKRELFVISIIAPMLILFFLFQIWPVIKLFTLSLQNWSDVLSGNSNSWTLDNYRRLLTDPVFWKVLKNTFVFTLIRVPIGLVFGLIIALAINQTHILRGWFIGAFYSPIITSVVAMALVFSYFYHPIFGLFNYILSSIGLPPQTFLSDPKEALYCIILVDLWKSIGFEVIIFLAGLQAIPEEYYEATAIEGANSFQTFWSITFPLLAPTTFLLIITDVISTMRIFTPIFVMTGVSAASRGSIGGPLDSTNVLTLYMYKTAFYYNNFSYSSAIAIVQFIIVVLITIIQLKALKVSWEY